MPPRTRAESPRKPPRLCARPRARNYPAGRKPGSQFRRFMANRTIFIHNPQFSPKQPPLPPPSSALFPKCPRAPSTTTTTTTSSSLSISLSLQPPHKTALHWAAQNGDVHELKHLLSLGLPIDVVDQNGERPLHFATWYGQLEATRSLVENGADVRSPSFAFPQGTPLTWALTNGYQEIGDVLRSAVQREGGGELSN